MTWQVILGSFIGALLGNLVLSLALFWIANRRKKKQTPYSKGLHFGDMTVDFAKGLTERLERFNREMAERQAQIERQAEASEKAAIERAKEGL